MLKNLLKRLISARKTENKRTVAAATAKPVQPVQPELPLIFPANRGNPSGKT